MVEGGAGLSSRARVATAGTKSRSKSHAAKRSGSEPVPSSHWGLALRRVLFSPGDGFKRALRLSRGKDSSRAGAMLIPTLAAFGGAYLMLLFLKVRGLIGFEGVTAAEFRWGVFALALTVGAVVGVIAHFLFGALARPLVARSGKRCESRDLRTIWGVAVFPIALFFVLIVGLDIVIGGRDVYLASMDGDTLITGWAAGSLVLTVCAAAWSIYLFVRGLGVAGDMRPSRSFATILVALICLIVSAPVAIGLVTGVVTLVGFTADLIQAVTK